MARNAAQGRPDVFQARQVTRPRKQVEEQIKEAILAGQFDQGEKLPSEVDLAQQFGVSRPTVREALAALASAGLIRKAAGVSGGSFVNSVTPDSLSRMLSQSMDTILRLGSLDLHELTDIRWALEIPAARWAAVNRTDEDIRQLRAIVDTQRTTTIDDPQISSYDQAFHTTIGRVSGNRLLAAFVAAVHDTTHPAQFLDVTTEVGRKTVIQHLAILSAIEAQDPDAAAEAMIEHLDYVLQCSSSSATEHPEIEES